MPDQEETERYLLAAELGLRERQRETERIWGFLIVRNREN